jgi:hypothetical protein
LDKAENAFGVLTLENLASARSFEGQAKGGTNCTPPFEGLGKGRVALAKAFEVLGRINGVGKRDNDVGDDKPPFVIVNGAADFLALEEDDFGGHEDY